MQSLNDEVKDQLVKSLLGNGGGTTPEILCHTTLYEGNRVHSNYSFPHQGLKGANIYSENDAWTDRIALHFVFLYATCNTLESKQSSMASQSVASVSSAKI